MIKKMYKICVWRAKKARFGLLEAQKATQTFDFLSNILKTRYARISVAKRRAVATQQKKYNFLCIRCSKIWKIREKCLSLQRQGVILGYPVNM